MTRLPARPFERPSASSVTPIAIQAIAKAETHTRWQTANGALNGIYLALGEKRDLTVTSIFEAEARAR